MDPVTSLRVEYMLLLVRSPGIVEGKAAFELRAETKDQERKSGNFAKPVIVRKSEDGKLRQFNHASKVGSIAVLGFASSLRHET